MKDLEKIAKKQFGQNFLKDEVVLNKIIQSIPNNDLIIAEIGAGLGDLTNKLLELKNDVVAFEVDIDLLGKLEDRFKEALNNKKLMIKFGDVLEYWGDNKNLLQKNYAIVANLPYYIATNIILRALRDDNCKFLIVMVQKEVAEKFCAVSGSSEFSSLAILASYCGTAKILFDVLPSSFVPAPKVISSVMMIKKTKNLDNKEYEQFLKISFSQPRKKLSKNLSARYSKELIEESFEKLNISSNIRPHELPSSTYHQLFILLYKVVHIDERREAKY
ncbi:MAG: 16S rRNA (adenine(1518)-N(6)/adenine(1519)-N(6))-dimethyltransferase RsmA [Campylobacterales bacterium]|nr:16S rRNA (adenine(1518)-N(6)/adenine(1519)-N(6))-dimethyltransferase RsmA [Campylobacterales bacterium]